MSKVKEAFCADTRERAKEGLYLIRGYQSEDPYVVITDYDDETANEINQKCFPQRYADYMEVRRNVDSWLRNEAEKIGTDISKSNPISFALVRDLDAVLAHMPSTDDDKNLDAEAEEPKDSMIILPLKDMDLSCWSFTVDDSFVGAPQCLKGSYDNLGHPTDPLHGRVLSPEEMLDHITHEGFLRGEIDGNPRYFEAQLWAEAPTMLDKSQTPKPDVRPGLQL